MVLVFEVHRKTMKMILAVVICCAFLVPLSSSADAQVPEINLSKDVIKKEEYLQKDFDWISDKFLSVLDTFIPNERTERTNNVEGRKRKKMKLNKYVFPLLIGFMLIKSVLLPLALKSLAILSGKAIVLSLMSLILAAIIGLRSMAGNGNGDQGAVLREAASKIDLVNFPLAKYRRKDYLENAEPIDEEPYPYRYYAERRRRRKK